MNEFTVTLVNHSSQKNTISGKVNEITMFDAMHTFLKEKNIEVAEKVIVTSEKYEQKVTFYGIFPSEMYGYSWDSKESTDWNKEEENNTPSINNHPDNCLCPFCCPAEYEIDDTQYMQGVIFPSRNTCIDESQAILEYAKAERESNMAEWEEEENREQVIN